MSTFSLSLQQKDNPFFNGQSSHLFSTEIAKTVLGFHQQIDAYEPTPLVSLDQLANKLGIGKILVKDESYRFNLNAFKVLGGSYAIAQCVCQKLGISLDEFTFDSLKGQEPITFATATDGNHGRGVAWAAHQLGQKAVVYMPKGAAKERVDNILKLGAECIVTDLNYDDAVRLACKNADDNGWLMVQDTAWEGYTKIPTWIMQGYMTMASEACDQLEAMGIKQPTHAILQAGVGALAGGAMGYLANRYSAESFRGIVAEPDKADCIYQSGCSPQGTAVNVPGDLDTIMAGLACGEPNPLGWEILRNCSRHFLSVEDKVAALGMRILASPLPGDKQVISGESGAIGIGLLYAIAQHPDAKRIMESLKLNKDSVVLLFNTEGDTDPVNYLDVVWEGKYAV
ncbi:diaminopropionate ammonia-lyase [Endozoicomonas montiporae]|uniref:Diaminopropionate ammonia-lyase n=2 Tax=Endozoicomonas montiporae TaxID=1027273 RepID=A0A081N4T0_9GAMM|nr:diaminopropionate ammonia-lyase [Endozoicomonas montiporae]AMO57678.1 diaminopropionate ammonia-lyase [Endozoicomonas montiporae CL-33]KEQ13453.1 diaminopropionate ammonia-lyase [Endozoicomonas montiporae]